MATKQILSNRICFYVYPRKRIGILTSYMKNGGGILTILTLSHTNASLIAIKFFESKTLAQNEVATEFCTME